MTFSTSTTQHDVPAYSRYYGFLPHTRVATYDGWKEAAAHKCRYTGKTADVIKARRLAHADAHDRSAIDIY